MILKFLLNVCSLRLECINRQSITVQIHLTVQNIMSRMSEAMVLQQRLCLQPRGVKQNWASHCPHEDLLTTVKRRKLKWYGHVTRSTELAKTILQGTVQGRRRRRRGRQKKMGGQHPGMDWHDAERCHEEG